MVADIRNCRILVFDPPPAHHVRRQFGVTGRCDTAAGHFASPNGDTPLPDGNLLVTEIGRRSAAELDLASGRILYRVPLPVVYASDAQPTRGGQYLTVDYVRPGKVVIVARSGRPVWSYGPNTGPGMLNHPSLAIELPNGNVLLNDDDNNRVLVLSRRTRRILWQYGVTGVPGRQPGYLHDPDGVDLKPPAFGR